MISESGALPSVSGRRLSIAPTPRHLLLRAAACTDATLRLRRGSRKTTCRMSCSAQSPDDRRARRRATRPDTSAPAPGSCLSLLPPTPPHVAILRALLRIESGRNDTVCGSMKIMSRTGIPGSTCVRIIRLRFPDFGRKSWFELCGWNAPSFRPGMPTSPFLCQSLSLKTLFRCHVSFGKRQVCFNIGQPEPPVSLHVPCPAPPKSGSCSAAILYRLAAKE